MACGHLKVGAPDWSSFHHISQLVPEDPRDQAQFSLPGDIKVIGETFVIGAIPSVRLVLPGHCKGEWVAANLHFAEHSADLRQALIEEWEQELDSSKKPPKTFHLEIDFGEVSFDDLMDLLETEGELGEFPVSAMLRLAVGFSGKGKKKSKSELVSPCFRGEMLATHIDYIPSPPDPGHPWPYFECHSHWFREPLKKKNRRWFTKCFGSCPKTRCACNKKGHGHCWGLHFCWC